MKKPALAVIIIIDLAVMSGAAYVLLNRLPGDKSKPDIKTVEVPALPKALEPDKTSPLSGPPKSEVKRRILFSVRVAKAKRVQITGDFTDWKPESLRRGKNNVWSIVMPLSPGVYAYNFIVNGKRKIKDPNNPRATPDGKSILTVKGNP